MADKEPIDGIVSTVRLIVVPGIYGIVLSLAFFRFLPKVLSYSIQQSMPLNLAVNRSFIETVAPYVHMAQGYGIDWFALALPAVGFVIFAFAYILYKSDNL